jgi:hypothetical protein
VTTLPQEFVDVLAQRIADYSGRDLHDVRATVRYAGDELPVRIADLMLEDMRIHAEGSPQYEAEHQSAHRRLIEMMHARLAEVGAGAGTLVQQRQHARADAERVFALAVDVVDPIAVGIEVPRALELQHEARIAAARGVLHGLPEDRVPTGEKLAAWLAEGERVAAAAPGDTERRRLVGDVRSALLRAAGDRQYEPRTSTRGPEETLRDGTARAWVRQRLPELAGTLGVPLESADRDLLPDGFESRMVDGLVQSIAELTGQSEEAVLDRLCVAGDPRNTHDNEQWPTARRLLVPDESLEHLDEYEQRKAGWMVQYAMQDEFKRHYGNPDRTPDLTPEEVGASIAAAGAATAADFGVRLEAPVQHDSSLDPIVNAASVPPPGGQASVAGQGERATRPGTQPRDNQITGRG